MRLRKRAPSLAVAAAGIALTLVLACRREGADASENATAPRSNDSPVVARLNGEPIAIADLQGGYPRALRSERIHAIDNAVRRRLAAREARRRGLDATSVARGQIEALWREAEAREEMLLREALMASLAAELVLTEAELKARYDELPVRYTRRRMQLRRAAFDSAEAARSEDERLAADGRLDPATSEQIGPVYLGSQMQAQMPGLSSLRHPGQRIVVEGEGGSALVELVEELPQAPQPFEEVWDEVEGDLRSLRGKEAFDELADELVAAARVEFVEEVIRDDAEWQQSWEEAAPLRRPWR